MDTPSQKLRFTQIDSIFREQTTIMLKALDSASQSISGESRTFTDDRQNTDNEAVSFTTAGTKNSDCGKTKDFSKRMSGWVQRQKRTSA